MWQLKHISYFNIYENVILYLFKFMATPYQFQTFSYRFFFLHLISF